MKLVDAHARLLQMKQPVFQTADAAALLKIENAHASKLLERLADSGHLLHLSRSLWGLSDKVEPLALAGYLTAPFPSYVSLQTALYYHGMISQIPAVTYAVSLARTRRFTTPLGTVSVHHIDPSFFHGFEVAEGGGFAMATPEKALLDVLYLGPAKSGLFRVLPEVDLPSRFRFSAAQQMIRRIPSARCRSLVTSRFEQLVNMKENRQ